VKFSDLLGEPEPEETPAAAPAERSGAPAEPDPITVFSPVPEPDRPPPPAVPPVPPAPPVPSVPAPSDADATIPTPFVPPPVNPPYDPVTPPFDPVNPPLASPGPPLDPVLDAPPPDPTLAIGAPGGRSDLASLNVHQPVPEPEPPRSSVTDQLAGLDEVVDDLLPPRRSRR
jgi:hypothetical protein